MNVFIMGMAGGVGRRVAKRLVDQGHRVSGWVRRPEQVEAFSREGIQATVGDLVRDPVATLAQAIRGHDIVLFSAGAGGKGSPEAITAVDGDGPGKVAQAMQLAGVSRLYLVSVFPEAGRGRDMGASFEHYMVEKKKAETQVVATDLDWVILRPSALIDDAGVGAVDLGLAKVHTQIRRDDVADTLLALMQRPQIRRSILEATAGTTPIADAVDALTSSS